MSIIHPDLRRLSIALIGLVTGGITALLLA
jgi:hypothetical protein